jgi:hypothetical protein
VHPIVLQPLQNDWLLEAIANFTSASLIASFGALVLSGTSVDQTSLVFAQGARAETAI